MKRTWVLFGVVTAIGGVATIAGLSIPGSAAPSTSAPSTTTSSTPPTSSGPPVVLQRGVISLTAAQRLATAAQQDCAARGFAVTVAVVDTDGVDVLVQRGDGTTGATVAVARGKAHAAAGFQSPTGSLQNAAAANPGLIAIPDFVILPGGEPIRIDGTLVGGVGVSGTPSGDTDDQCALAGINAITSG